MHSITLQTGALAPKRSGAPSSQRSALGQAGKAGRVLPASGPTSSAARFSQALRAEGREALRIGRHLRPYAGEFMRRLGKDTLMLTAAGLFAGGMTLGLPALWTLVSR